MADQGGCWPHIREIWGEERASLGYSRTARPGKWLSLRLPNLPRPRKDESRTSRRGSRPSSYHTSFCEVIGVLEKSESNLKGFRGRHSGPGLESRGLGGSLENKYCRSGWGSENRGGGLRTPTISK